MSTDEVRRVEEDLRVMRQSLRLDRPYDRRDVFPLIVLGCGALVALPLLYARMFANPRICMLLCLAPGALLFVRRYFDARREQAERPNLWFEYRFSAVAVLLGIPAVVGWIWWSQQRGLSRIEAGAPLMFCIGMASLFVGLFQSDRRQFTVIGIGIMAFAAVLPLIRGMQIPYFGSLLIAGLAFGSAAFIRLQTRPDSESTGGQHE